MFIGHTCACRHGDLTHSISATTGRRTCGSNPCARRCRRNEQPELLPTFDTKGALIERIVPPGEGLATQVGTATPKTCPCRDCRALYTQLTGIELPDAQDRVEAA